MNDLLIHAVVDDPAVLTWRVSITDHDGGRVSFVCHVDDLADMIAATIERLVA